MEGSIFVMQPDNSLVKVNRTPYNSEALLQGLLSDYPDLLAGDQMNTVNPRRWLLVSPELSLGTEADGTGGWWIDHLFLDQDAIPTIVEVKRSSDSRIRREVVGQMLDYAAHLEVYWPAERIRAYFEERCRAKGPTRIRKIGELLEEEETDTERHSGRAWERISSIGKMRLLFVADEMPMHLQRVVEFLNKYMSPVEVLRGRNQAVRGKQSENTRAACARPDRSDAARRHRRRSSADLRSADRTRKPSSPNCARRDPPDEVIGDRAHSMSRQWQHDVEFAWGTGQDRQHDPDCLSQGYKALLRHLVDQTEDLCGFSVICAQSFHFRSGVTGDLLRRPEVLRRHSAAKCD